MKIEEFQIFLARTIRDWNSQLNRELIGNTRAVICFNARATNDPASIMLDSYQLNDKGFEHIGNDVGADVIIMGTCDDIKDILEEPSRIESYIRESKVRLVGDPKTVDAVRTVFQAAKDGR